MDTKSGSSGSGGSLEVKVLNCKDLKPTNFNFFQKLIAFVSVALASDDPERRPRSQPQKTTTEEEQDSNLDWNREMSFDLDGIRFDDCDHLFLAFVFFSPGNLIFDDKEIGEVRVPFRDLVAEGSDGVARFRSYEVRTVDGKPNGVLHFSYKMDLKNVLRIDNGFGGAVDCDQKPKMETLPAVAKIEYPAIDWNEVNGSCGVVAQHETGGSIGVYPRTAEVVHTAHNGFPVSGDVHSSSSHELTSGYYTPPPPVPPQMMHMYPPGPPPPPPGLPPPPPGLPPHMMYQHQPHSPGSHHIGSPFPGLLHPPLPPLHMSGDFGSYGSGYDHGTSHHGGGESRLVEDGNLRDRGMGVHYPDYWSGR